MEQPTGSELAGRVAIVTGGARGIGAAVARALAARGAALVVGDVDGPAAEAMAATLPNARGLRADVAEPDDAEALARAAENGWGRLDILVNNAGVAVARPFMDTTPADIERVTRVNLVGTLLCSQAALRRMVPAGRGRIINVSSISGQLGSWGRTAYGGSKAAVELMTKVMAAELARPGLTVNAVAPGPIETEMAATLHDAATRRAYGHRVPQNRYGTVEEVAAAVCFLASDAAAYVCGHVLNVDGGFASQGFVLPRNAAEGAG